MKVHRRFSRTEQEAQFIHSFSERHALQSMQTFKSYKTAPCTRNSDDRADRIKVAERLGDMITADHKIFTEEQESRMHHKYAVVQDLAAPYSKLPMQNQISSGGAKAFIENCYVQKKTLDPFVRTIVCFFQACEGLNWNRERSTPNKSETCKGNTSKDPFSQCELYKEFAFRSKLSK